MYISGPPDMISVAILLLLYGERDLDRCTAAANKITRNK